MKLNKEAIKAGCKAVLNTLHDNSPAILTATGIVGATVAIIFVAKEAPKAKEELDSYDWEEPEDAQEFAEQTFEKARIIFPYYWKSVLLFSASMGCIIFAQRAQAGRTAALASAYSLLKTTTDEYKDKVIEIVGEKKADEIETEIARDHVISNPPMTGNIIETGNGKVLCMESLTGQYFFSDADHIKRMENMFNQHLNRDTFGSVNDWLDMLGIRTVGLGEDKGWNINRDLLVVKFRSILTDTDVPVLVVDYAYDPMVGYEKWY